MQFNMFGLVTVPKKTIQLNGFVSVSLVFKRSICSL